MAATISPAELFGSAIDLVKRLRKSPATVEFVLILVLAVLAYWLTGFGEGSWRREHAILAEAMARGHLWVGNIPSAMEQIHFNGRVYLVHPPGVALLMLPFAWLFGSVDQMHFAIALGAAGVGAAWLLAQKDRRWLAIFFGFGTVYWWAVTIGDSWHLALVASVPFSLLALRETLEDGNPWIAGLCAGFAALCRYDLVLAWPFYLFLWRRLFTFAATLIPAALLLLWFNWARFGNPFQTDLALYVQTNFFDLHPLMPFGPFSPHYLPQNLDVVLFMPPHLDDRWPYLHPHMAGQALIFTSPAFLVALRARLFTATLWARLSTATVCLWLMMFSVMVPCMLVWATGYEQLGARYWIQAYPFMFALMCRHATDDGLDRFDKMLICLSIAMVWVSIFIVRHYGWSW